MDVLQRVALALALALSVITKPYFIEVVLGSCTALALALSQAHTANEPVSQRSYYFFHFVYCSSRLVEAATEFTFRFAITHAAANEARTTAVVPNYGYCQERAREHAHRRGRQQQQC